jgi:hypothetical protein
MENSSSTTTIKEPFYPGVESYLLSQLRASIGKVVSIRKLAMDAKYGSVYCQLILVAGKYKGKFISNVDSPRGKYLIDPSTTEEDLKTILRIAGRSRGTFSLETVEEVFGLIPLNQWFEKESIPHSSARDVGYILLFLYNVGKLRRKLSSDSKSYQYALPVEGKEPLEIGAETDLDSPGVNKSSLRVLKALQKLEVLKSSGTRLSLNKFLREKDCPYYNTLPEILYNRGYVLNNSHGKVMWNKDRRHATIPNIIIAGKVLEEAKQAVKKRKEQSTRSSKTIKAVGKVEVTLSKNANRERLIFFDMMVKLMESITESSTGEIIKKEISTTLEKAKLTELFKQHYLEKKSKDLDFLTK